MSLLSFIRFVVLCLPDRTLLVFIRTARTMTEPGGRSGPEDRHRCGFRCHKLAEHRLLVQAAFPRPSFCSYLFVLGTSACMLTSAGPTLEVLTKMRDTHRARFTNRVNVDIHSGGGWKPQFWTQAEVRPFSLLPFFQPSVPFEARQLVRVPGSAVKFITLATTPFRHSCCQHTNSDCDLTFDHCSGSYRVRRLNHPETIPKPLRLPLNSHNIPLPDRSRSNQSDKSRSNLSRIG